MRELIRRNKSRFVCLAGAAAMLMLLTLMPPSIPVTPVEAQGTTSPTDTSRDFDEKTRLFFEQLKSGNTTTAFDTIVQNGPLGAKSAGGQISDIRDRFAETKKNLFGEIFDWEKHSSKRIGEDIVVVRYILKCENYPMVWTFTFYRRPVMQSSLSTGPISVTASVNPNPWNLIEMRFDSSLDLLSL